jgi:hypothetical protein
VIGGIPLGGKELDARETLLNVINDVIRGSTAMLSCVEQVMREIADEPKHFETHKGSIVEFKNLYGVNPFMPASNMLYVLNHAPQPKDESFMLPFNTLGDDSFKLAYGNRGTVHRMEMAPSTKMSQGFVDLISLYNTMSDSKFAVNSGAAEKFFSALVKGVRYIHDVKNVKGALVPLSEHQSMIDSAAIVPLNLSTISMSTDASSLKLAYVLSKPSLETNARETVTLSESSNVLDKQDVIAKHVASDIDTPRDHSQLRITNILDLNIVPINVNAMMREMPLVNLYNYSYTFDRMLVEVFYGVGKELAMDLIKNLCNLEQNNINFNVNIFNAVQTLDADAEKSTTAMFVSMMVNPYKNITSETSFALLEALFRGETDSGMQRPQFLSDQLYGKALFGSLYPSDYSGHNASLTGPNRVGILIRRDNAGSTPSRIGGPINGWLEPEILQKPTEISYMKSRSTKVDVPAAAPYKQYGWGNVKSVTVGNKAQLITISKNRLDTVLVRNLMMIVNAYRALRFKISKDLMYNTGKTRKSRFITPESMTEFNAN